MYKALQYQRICFTYKFFRNHTHNMKFQFSARQVSNSLKNPIKLTFPITIKNTHIREKEKE